MKQHLIDQMNQAQYYAEFYQQCRDLTIIVGVVLLCGLGIFYIIEKDK